MEEGNSSRQFRSPRYRFERGILRLPTVSTLTWMWSSASAMESSSSPGPSFCPTDGLGSAEDGAGVDLEPTDLEAGVATFGCIVDKRLL